MGKDLAVDFAITCRLQHKYLVDSFLMSGFSCNDYAAEIKCKSYQSRLQAEGIMYLPFVLETFGRFSDDTSDFLNKLISDSGISSRFSEPKRISSKQAYKSLSCALMKMEDRSLLGLICFQLVFRSLMQDLTRTQCILYVLNII